MVEKPEGSETPADAIPSGSEANEAIVDDSRTLVDPKPGPDDDSPAEAEAGGTSEDGGEGNGNGKKTEVVEPAPRRKKQQVIMIEPGAGPRVVILLGAGPHALRVLEMVESDEAWTVMGFVYERNAELRGANQSPQLGELEQLGGFDMLPRLGKEHKRLYAVVGFADPTLRRHHWLRFTRAGIHPARVVHPLASISARAACEPGLVAFPGAVVGAHAVLEQNVSLGPNSCVTHGARIGAHAYLDAGAVLLEDARVGARSAIGPNVVINPSVTVGEDSIIGSGSVVTRDVPERSIAYGNPARIVRKRKDT